MPLVSTCHVVQYPASNSEELPTIIIFQEIVFLFLKKLTFTLVHVRRLLTLRLIILFSLIQKYKTDRYDFGQLHVKLVKLYHKT